MDVRTLMRRAAAHYSHREAVVHNERRLNFAQAWRRGVQLANGLLDLGLQPGDRVGVLEDNSPIWCACRCIPATAGPPTCTCSATPTAGPCW
jgi:acyl-CoA synthetase (AMP-forming)/AMP-acid ligase II